VTLNQTDGASGFENQNGAITFKTPGTYFVIAAGQIGGTGNGTVRLWMRQNGTDIGNSNTEQTIAGGSTSVIVCQGVGEFKAGDKLELAFSASTEGLGLVASKPAKGPAVPSMIFSAFQVDSNSFGQLSSSENQAAATSPKVIGLNSTDAAKGLENDRGSVSLKNAGVYFVIAAAQAGATGTGGNGSVRLWMRQNGTDIGNSNTEQSIANGSTAVLVCQGIGAFAAGDKLQLAMAGKGAGTGIVASSPKGESGIPSMILSAFKVAGNAYAQLSTGKTQISAEPKAITLESTDAASEIDNSDGTITIKQSGVYFLIAAGQVGGSGNGTVQLWLRQNGADVDNSNAEQTVTNGSTSVLVSQGVMTLQAGDKLQLMQCAKGDVGMIASTPSGEPAIPSMILSIVRVDSGLRDLPATPK
jgi:hypothetical protein